MNDHENSSTTKCVIFGGCGAANTGDLLLAAVSLHRAQEAYADSVTMLSDCVGMTSLNFPDVQTVPYDPRRVTRPSLSIFQRVAKRLKPTEGGPVPWTYQANDNSEDQWKTAVQSADTLYVTGGGTYMDLYDLLDYYLLPVQIAKDSNTRVVFGPNGLGPFSRRESVRRLQEVCSGLDLVVRDNDSHSFCKQNGIKAELRLDDGFQLPAVLPNLKSESHQRTLGVNICQQIAGTDGAGDFRWWVSFLKEAQRAFDRVVGFCFQYNPQADYSLTRRAFAEAGIEPHQVRQPELHYARSCEQLNAVSAIASSRFHAVVVGNVLEKATLAISSGPYYDSKMTAATEHHPRSFIARPRHTAPGDAVKLLTDAMSN